MKTKVFLQKKYLIFYLAIISFILLLIGVLVIGLETKTPHLIITLPSLGKDIQNLNKIGIEPPTILLTTYNLLVTGLIFSGAALVFLFVNLLSIKKISKFQNWYYWSGILCVLLSLILMIAGIGYYVDETMKNIDPNLTFADVWNVFRFVGLIICLTILPLTTTILGIMFAPKMNKPVQKTK